MGRKHGLKTTTTTTIVTSATDSAGDLFQNRSYHLVTEVSVRRAPTAAWSDAAVGARNYDLETVGLGACRDTHGGNFRTDVRNVYDKNANRLVRLSRYYVVLL